MDDEKRRLRDEVADLSKAVRELREQLSQRDAHECHGCHGAHPVWVWPYAPTYPAIHYPYAIICGNTTTTHAPAISSSSVTSTYLGTITYS